jgi:hypothetical protein
MQLAEAAPENRPRDEPDALFRPLPDRVVVGVLVITAVVTGVCAFSQAVAHFIRR